MTWQYPKQNVCMQNRVQASGLKQITVNILLDFVFDYMTTDCY